ncbi:20S proteasome subunit beta 2 [Sarotherodon galilaeus]
MSQTEHAQIAAVTSTLPATEAGATRCHGDVAAGHRGPGDVTLSPSVELTSPPRSVSHPVFLHIAIPVTAIPEILMQGSVPTERDSACCKREEVVKEKEVLASLRKLLPPRPGLAKTAGGELYASVSNSHITDFLRYRSRERRRRALIHGLQEEGEPFATRSIRQTGRIWAGGRQGRRRPKAITSGQFDPIANIEQAGDRDSGIIGGFWGRTGAISQSLHKLPGIQIQVVGGGKTQPSAGSQRDRQCGKDP